MASYISLCLSASSAHVSVDARTDLVTYISQLSVWMDGTMSHCLSHHLPALRSGSRWCLASCMSQTQSFRLFGLQVPVGRCVMLASAVSSALLGAIAAAEGFRFVETLTGFKWLGNTALRLEQQEGAVVLFAFEEAIGFMLGPMYRVSEENGSRGRAGGGTFESENLSIKPIRTRARVIRDSVPGPSLGYFGADAHSKCHPECRLSTTKCNAE